MESGFDFSEFLTYASSALVLSKSIAIETGQKDRTLLKKMTFADLSSLKFKKSAPDMLDS